MNSSGSLRFLLLLIAMKCLMNGRTNAKEDESQETARGNHIEEMKREKSTDFGETTTPTDHTITSIPETTLEQRDAEYRGTAKRNNEKTERGISTNSDKTTTTRAHPTRVTSDSDKILASTSISYKAKDKTRFIASERARTSTTPYNTSITPNTSSSTTESSEWRESNSSQKWRNDGRCGKNYPLFDGTPSECNPDGENPCCYKSEYLTKSIYQCGNKYHQCLCHDCIDYRVVKEIRNSSFRTNNCSVVKVHGGFLRHVCFDDNKKQIFYKCLHSDVYYTAGYGTDFQLSLRYTTSRKT